MKMAQPTIGEPQQETHEEGDDDFFGSQDNDQQSEELRRDRELEALRRPHYTAGLREGASAAHDAHLQEGFDEGFADGAKAVTYPAFLLGACSLLSKFYEKHGCTADSDQSSQNIGDSEVPTAHLRQVSRVASRLRTELTSVPLGTVIHADDAETAMTNLSLAEVPPSIRSTASRTTDPPAQ